MPFLIKSVCKELFVDTGDVKAVSLYYRSN